VAKIILEEMEKTEIYQKGISREEAYKKLFALLDDAGGAVTLRNANDGEEALLSKRSVRKLLSGAASDKSEDNGFTPAQHFAVAADIEDIFANSLKVSERPDRDGNPDITIHRFAAPLHFKDAVAYMTVKESALDGKRIYSVELIEIKKLGGTLADTKEEFRPQPRSELDTEGKGTLADVEKLSYEQPSSRLYTNNIRKLREKVNSKSEKNKQTPTSNASKGE